MDDKQSRALALAATRDDVLLTSDARALGLTHWEVEGLRRASGLVVVRGALAIPPVRDPLRTAARAVQLQLPRAVLSHVTGARLHGVQGLGWWDPTEPVDATVASHATRAQRRGVRLRFANLAPSDVVDINGLAVTSVLQTLTGCADVLDRDRFVAIVDSALHLGLLSPCDLELLRQRLAHRRRGRYLLWLDLVDGRAESPSETAVRLVLVDGGLVPDELQYDVYTPDGFHVARLDMAYVKGGRKVGLEVDSAWHDGATAPYRDRRRLNALRGLGWDIRLVTARDALRQPGYVLNEARQALALQTPPFLAG